MIGVKGGIPQISCQTLTTNESVSALVMKTIPEQSILVGFDQSTAMGSAGPLMDSIYKVWTGDDVGQEPTTNVDKVSYEVLVTVTVEVTGFVCIGDKLDDLIEMS